MANLSGKAPQKLVTIQPYFTVLDEAKAAPIRAAFVESTKAGTSGCLYYGWTMDGPNLFCREAYADGETVLAHLQDVDAHLKAMLAEGVAKLERIEIHGPAAELDKVREATAAFGTKYFAVESGFQCMQRAAQ